MDTFDSIIRGELRPFLPDKKGSDFYLPELRSMQMPIELYIPHFELRFPIPEFSAKTKYYKKLIDAAVIDTLNKIYRNYNEASDARIAYKYKNLTSVIKKNLNQLFEIIQSNGYDLQQLQRRDVNFKVDTDMKECSYILNYLMYALLQIHLDFQDHFKDKIDEQKKISLEEFYTNVFGVLPPDEPILRHVHVPVEVVIESGGKKVRTVTDDSIFSFNVTFPGKGTFFTNLWLLLEQHELIGKCPLTDFQSSFNGKKPKQKIVWKGGKTLLKEFIVKYTSLIQGVSYGSSKWDAACNTFVGEDGEAYDPEKLRKQQKPKLDADLIESILKEAVDAISR